MVRCFCLMIVIGSAVPTAAQDVFFAGAATADLTPGEGVSLDGPISKPGPVLGVHDPLMARAIAMRHGDISILIVVNDLCMMDRETHDAAKRLVFKRTGIPIAHQLTTATHSHATPRVTRISTKPPDEAYRKLVARRISEAASRAVANMVPAKIGFATFEMPDLVACRRQLCAPGSVGVNPFGESGEVIKSVAGSSSQVLRPAGPIDPEFSILSLQRLDGSPLAVLGNFSVHYCGGYTRGLVSADYFGCYARRLESVLSEKTKDSETPFVGLMSNATSGDTGSFKRMEGSNPAWSRMEYFGNLLADRTLDELGKIQHTTPNDLKVVTTELPLQVRKPDAARVDWARQLIEDPEAKLAHRWSRIYAAETLHLDTFPNQYNVPLQAIRIGDIGIAAAPCEIFAETGLAIKAASPMENTITMELANGYSGYLPSRQQHEWGGYETWPARSSHLEVDAESKIRDELVRLLGAP